MKSEQLNIGVVRLADGTMEAGLYIWPHKDFCRALCDEHESALTGDDVLWALPLWVQGRTYQERKENLFDLAVSAQNAVSEAACFSHGELRDIGAFFEEQGRRYGLLREFRENAIC